MSATSPTNDSIVYQLGVLQEAIGQAAQSMGVSVAPSFSTPVGTAVPQNPTPAPAAAKTEAPIEGASSAASPGSTATGMGPMLVPKKSASVGEFAPTPVGTPGWAADDYGAAAASSVALPSSNDLGNLNQVLGTIGTLSGNSDAASAFRPNNGLGAGSIVMPPMAQNSLTRGPLKPSDTAPIGLQDAGKVKFGDLPEFSMARGDRAPGRDVTAQEQAREQQQQKDQQKKQDDDQKQDDKNKGKKSDQEIAKEFKELTSKRPKFTQDDYKEFKNFIAENFDRLKDMTKNDPQFGQNATAIFKEFAGRDQIAKDAERKRLYQRFVDGDTGPKFVPPPPAQSVLDEGPSVAPEEGEERLGGRQSAPTTH